jgi:hypothetical protein
MVKKSINQLNYIRLNYLDYNNGLLYDIVDFSLYKIKQCAHTFLSRRFNFDGTTTDSSDRFSYKVNIDFCGIP